MSLLVSLLLAANPHSPADELATIDQRIELMFAIQLLSGYEKSGLVSRFETTYVQEMRAHFQPFAAHAAVKQFQRCMTQGFNFSKPHEFMLCHRDIASMKQQQVYSESLVKSLGGQAAADQFRQAVQQFAEESKASEFFQKQQPVYRAMMTKAEESLGIRQLVQQLEEYTGSRLPEAKIILMPLGHTGGYAVHFQGARQPSYALIGPLSSQEKMPLFQGDTSLKLLIWHELGHLVINPMVDQCTREVDESAPAFQPLKQKLRAEACSDWSSCVKETLVRALVNRLAEKHLSPAVALADRVAERQLGWLYLDEFLATFVQWEKESHSNRSIEKLKPLLYKQLQLLRQSVSNN